MKRQGADIRIVGTEAEIGGILTELNDKGFTWRSNEYFYPRINQPELYSYYLESFKPPSRAGLPDIMPA